MSWIADRPWPIRHEYKGNLVQIVFRYVDDSDVPTHAVIIPMECSVEVSIYDIVEGPWSSYVDAVGAATAAADRWIDIQME